MRTSIACLVALVLGVAPAGCGMSHRQKTATLAVVGVASTVGGAAVLLNRKDCASDHESPLACSVDDDFHDLGQTMLGYGLVAVGVSSLILAIVVDTTKPAAAAR